ncbi:MAG: hypothetical protein RIT45_3044 [Pseudomonadota bacterium]
MRGMWPSYAIVANRSTLRPTIQALWLACALLTATLALPRVSLAEGYNDWTTELPEPGEFWVVPAIQTRVHPTLSAYWQGQFQCGLHERADLILNAAGWLGDYNAFDATLIQPRILVAPWLALSPGIAVQGEVGGTPTSALPAVYATFETPSWLFDVNALFYLPFREPTQTDLFAVVVVERKLREGLSVYGEIDYWGSLRTPTDAPEIDVFVGTQFDIGDDTLNINLSMPIGPSPAPASVALGVWWAHGFTIRPLRRSPAP